MAGTVTVPWAVKPVRQLTVHQGQFLSYVYKEETNFSWIVFDWKDPVRTPATADLPVSSF